MGSDKALSKQWSEARTKRKGEKSKAEEKRIEEEFRKTARGLALKKVASLEPYDVIKNALGITLPDAHYQTMRGRIHEYTEEFLSDVRAGKVPKDDGAFADRTRPPVLPIMYDINYFWTETVDGVEYTVEVRHHERGSASVQIGKTHKDFYGLLGVDPFTHAISMEPRIDTKGDAYIAGKVVLHEEAKRTEKSYFWAAMFMLISHEKRQGAGTRVMQIWCDLMAGWGIRVWVAEAVGEEGEGFISALQDKGRLRILKVVGPSMLVECLKQGVSQDLGWGVSQNPSAHSRARVTVADARKAGKELGLNLRKEGFALEALRKGIEVELEHGSVDPSTDVTGDDLATTAKIALAHLRERTDYYDVLEDCVEQSA